jgi:hypothetical protein
MGNPASSHLEVNGCYSIIGASFFFPIMGFYYIKGLARSFFVGTFVFFVVFSIDSMYEDMYNENINFIQKLKVHIKIKFVDWYSQRGD